MKQLPALIAHRGHMRGYPENTVAALRYAMECGAQYIEFDVQLTGDHIPVLLHDETLLRTTGQAGLVTELSCSEVCQISAHYPERFGKRFVGEPIPTLRDVVALLNDSPHLTAFVEIKRQSIERFGVSTCLDAIATTLEGASFEWVLISFELAALEHARRHLHGHIGWVLRDYDQPSRTRAEALSPEYLFCDVLRLPDSTAALWDGCWHWVIYDIEDPGLAVELARRGADYVETGRIDYLLLELGAQ